MDDQHDGTYEILDLRPARNRRREDGAEADAPARAYEREFSPIIIELGGGAAATESSSAPPRWQRCAIMAAVFVAGAVTGAYGLYSATEAADASRVELIVVDLNGDVFGDVAQSRLYASVHNAGELDVTVLDLRVPGWTTGPDEPQEEVTVAAGKSAGMVVRGAPTCDAGPPESLEADVRTDTVVSSVLMPLSAASPIRYHIAMKCGYTEGLPPDDPGIYFNWDDQNLATETSPSQMLLDMESVLGTVEILDVSVTAPGFVAQASNVPFSIRHEAPGHLELVWTISDCAATYDLGSVDVELILADRAPVTTQLPSWSIAQLARLAANECGP